MATTVLLAISVIAVFAAITLIGTWTYLDAEKRGSRSPLTWGIVTGIFSPLLIYYLVIRRRIGDRTEPVQGAEAVLGILSLAVVTSLLVSLSISPPDPVTVGRNIVFAFPLGIGIGYILTATNLVTNIERRLRRIA